MTKLHLIIFYTYGSFQQSNFCMVVLWHKLYATTSMTEFCRENEQLKMTETKKKETKTIVQGSLAKVYLGLKQINCKIWKKIWYFSWFVWKVSESGVFSSLYFVKFGLKMEIYSYCIRIREIRAIHIQFKLGEIRSRISS